MNTLLSSVVVFFIAFLTLTHPVLAQSDVASQICSQAGTLSETCCQCVAGNTSCTVSGNDQVLGAWTAVGCIPASSEGIATGFVRLLVSIGGGVALLLILYGSFTVSTSASNPERLRTGQQIVTAAIAGLFFSLISVALLQLIGIDLLRLPGLSN